jgi:hypothetical protein
MLGPMWRLSHDRCFATVRKRSTFGRPNSALWSAAAKYPSNANPIQAMRASAPVNFLITLASLKSPVAGSPVRLNATAPVGPTLSKGLAHALSRLQAWTFYRSTNNDAAVSNIERQCHEICNSGYGSPTQSYQSLRSRGTGSNLPGAYSWSPLLHPLGIQTKIDDGELRNKLFEHGDLVKVPTAKVEQRRLKLLRSLAAANRSIQNPVVAALVSHSVQLHELLARGDPESSLLWRCKSLRFAAKIVRARPPDRPHGGSA